MLSDEGRRAKFQRFKGILEAPWGSTEKTSFPIYTTDDAFNLDDYMRESANPYPGYFEHALKVHSEALFMDIGCGYKGDVEYENLLNVEVYPSRSADLIVKPNHPFPIRSGSLDAIGCFAVLEHTRQPWMVVQEMQRMLKPGGAVYIDWPFLQPVHGFPNHFFNTTREGLKSIFVDQGFEVMLCETYPHQTVAYTTHWLLGRLQYHLHMHPEAQQELSRMSVDELIHLPTEGEVWQRWISLISQEAREEMACGNTLIARKVA